MKSGHLEAALDGYFPIDDEDIFDAFLDGGYCAVDEDDEIYIPPDVSASYSAMNTEEFQETQGADMETDSVLLLLCPYFRSRAA